MCQVSPLFRIPHFTNTRLRGCCTEVFCTELFSRSKDIEATLRSWDRSDQDTSDLGARLPVILSTTRVVSDGADATVHCR